MSSPSKELVPIAITSTLRATKSSESRLSFLSLPPEIRNQIYHYLFAPVRDETAWIVYSSHHDCTKLRGFRARCPDCFLDWAYTNCRCTHRPPEGLYRAFELISGYSHSEMLQTCRSIREEALSSLLAHMHIGIFAFLDCMEICARPLRQLLANLHHTKGGYLSELSCTSVGIWELPSTEKSTSISQFINDADIRIGRLELQEIWGKEFHSRRLIEYFANILQTLDHKPKIIRWVESRHFRSGTYMYEQEMKIFNDAVDIWLKETEVAKGAVPLPLLRDFLPQYFEESST